MPASLETVRAMMKVDPTRDDKGLILTLTVTAYDSGMMMVDGRPINEAQDPTLGWVGANEVIGTAMTEFYRQTQARKKSKVRSA
ncbi:hypothetical protein [Bradyrhizobium sp. URHC0002]